MNPSPQINKARRNLRVIFVLAFLLTVLASVSGGYVLVVGHSHPDVTFTMPAWQYGQFIMLFGLTNLFVYACIFFQVRNLIREVRDEKAA